MIFESTKDDMIITIEINSLPVYTISLHSGKKFYQQPALEGEGR